MPNYSARLRLKKPVSTDPFDTDSLASNWQMVDDYPGIWVSNAASPPSWGLAHAGMVWSQLDTGLLWRWNGVTFDRLSAVGSIGSASRTSDFTEATGIYATLVQKTGAVVPAGGRRIMVVFTCSEITGDQVEFQILRGATVLHDFNYWPGGGCSMTIFDTAVTAGTYTYSVQVKTKVTTSTVLAGATYPIQLEIIEV